jgi:hypothetical protein
MFSDVIYSSQSHSITLQASDGEDLLKQKGKPFPLYYQMQELVDKVIATGEQVFRGGARPAASQPENEEDEQGSEAPSDEERVRKDTEEGRKSPDVSEAAAPDVPSVRISLSNMDALSLTQLIKTPANGNRKRASTTTALKPSFKRIRSSGASAMSSIASAVESLAQSLTDNGNGLDPSPVRREKAFNKADAAGDDRSDDEMLTIYDIFQDTKKADTYNAISWPELAKKWLSREVNRKTAESLTFD